MLNVEAITVSKMTSRCAGTVQMREESERGVREWEEMWFKKRAEDIISWTGVGMEHLLRETNDRKAWRQLVYSTTNPWFLDG